jgi:hypothetical protein
MSLIYPLGSFGIYRLILMMPDTKLAVDFLSKNINGDALLYVMRGTKHN